MFTIFNYFGYLQKREEKAENRFVFKRGELLFFYALRI